MDPCRLLLQGSPGIFVALSRQGEILSHNAAYTELPRSPPADRDAAPSQERLLHACRRVLRSTESESFEMGSMGPAGPLLWYQCTVAPVRDERGAVVAASATCLDVTPHKREELRLRESEALLTDAQGVAHLGTWEYDLEQLRVTWSRELYSIYGESPEGYHPTFDGFLAKVHPDDRDRIRKTLGRVFREHIPFSHDERIVRPDGSVRHLHTWGHPIFNAEGKAVRLIGVCQDITERVQAESKARQSHAVLQAVVEGTTDSVFAKDLHGRYLMLNATAARVFNRPRAEIIGRTDDELLPPDIAKEFTAHDREVLQSGESQTFLETFKADGRVLTVHSTKWPYRDSDGAIIGIFGMARDITAIKQKSDELEHLLSLQRATLESTADGIFVTDCAQRITGFNQRLLQMWQLSRDEIIDRNYRDCLHLVLPQLECPEQCRRRLEEIFAHPDEDSFDVLHFKSGRVVERYSRPQQIAGETVGRVFSYRDVTARVKAEESLRISEARKHGVLDSALDSIISMNADGRIAEFNKAAEAQFGYRAADVIGRELADVIIPQRLRARHRAGLARFLRGGPGPFIGQRIETPAMRADGSEFPAEVSIVALQLADGASFTGFIRDVSDRKRYQERLTALAAASRALAEARLELAPIFQITAQVIAEALQEGCIVRLYPRDGQTAETVAYHHVEPEVLQLMELILPHSMQIIDPAATAELLRTGRPVSISVPLEQARQRLQPQYRAILDRFPFHAWLMLPLRVGGEIIGAMTVMRYRPGPGYSAEDEQFLMELADRAALAIDNARLYEESREATRIRDEFILMASHELRTPLTPLKLQLQLLSHVMRSSELYTGEKSENMLKLIGTSDQALARISRLVEDMLDVATLNTGQLKLHLSRFDLSALAHRVVDSLRAELRTAGCRIELSAEPGLEGDWDRNRLEHVLTHLLTNAMKFGAGKPIRVIATREDHHARLIVRDFGIGISAEDQARIFGRFERAVSITRFGGLGLGLYLARRIIELHGGRITVESTPGEGATFLVDLPLTR